MKKTLTILALLAYFSIVNAQVTDMGGPIGWKGKLDTKDIPTEVMPGFDLVQAQFEDSINDANKVGPWRFGYEYNTSYQLSNFGIWKTLPNGNRVWQLMIRCTDAQSINLQFENFHLPEGGYLYVYDTDQTNRVGAYTNKNHNPDGRLGTELVHGDEVIVEYYEPSAVMGQGDFTISMVVHGYRSTKEFANTLMAKALNSSGDCNVDVNCPLGIGWEDQIRSVGMLVNGGGFCSGALINNTCDDGTGYFLTAHHCGTASGSWNIRWNWESPPGTESCATTAGSVNPGPPYDQTSNGCTPVVQNSISDFNLISINNFTITNAQTWNLFYAGWDNSDALTVANVTAISHPSGDVKKIAVDNNPPTHQTTAFNGNPNAEMWYVGNYENGVTEPGSSGCPLFDQNGRIIGDLSGGSAACSGTNDNGGYDIYGRFATSWNNGVSTYLAPGGCGTTVTDDGFDPNAPSLADDAAIQSITDPTGLYCVGTINPVVVLSNAGINNLTSVTINYDIDGGTNQTFAWTGTLAPGATATVNLPAMAVASGAHTFNASTSLPNGQPDSNTGNDASSSSFTTMANGQAITLDLNMDCYGSEISWTIEDAGNNVLVSGSGYSDVPGGELITVNTCLDPGCYDFIINDSYGDGLYGSQWGGCSIDGTYDITQDATSANLATIQAVNSDFGNQEINNFCVVSPCTGTISETHTDVLCNGDATGSATISVAGGNAPFTYDIGAGPQGPNTFNGLVAGSYTVTVLDNAACSNTINVVISEPALLATIVNSIDETCPGVNDGQIVCTSTGGTAPYQYSINCGGTAQAGNSFAGLGPNTYCVEVEDANGCTTTENVTLTTGTGVSGTTTVTNISCNGLTDGSIQAVTSNGTAPFTYSIDGGTTTQTSANFAGLSAGPYTITITDANGCTGTVNGTVTEPSVISGTSVVTDELTGADGAINISIAGGTAPYTYSWSGTGGFTSSSEDISGLVTGNYTVIVTDANGCTFQITDIFVDSSVGLFENGYSFSIYPNPSNGNFNLELLNFDESVKVSIVDLTGRLIYESQLSGNNIFQLDITDKAAGTYFVRLQSGDYQIVKQIVKK